MIKKSMSILFLTIVILVALGCNKKNEPSTDLNITKSEWKASTSLANTATFGYVNLTLTGNTNCSKVTVQTHGDGDISDYDLLIDQNKNFNDTVTINFTHQVDNISRKYSTIVNCINNNTITKSVNLESDYLKFIN